MKSALLSIAAAFLNVGLQGALAAADRNKEGEEGGSRFPGLGSSTRPVFVEPPSSWRDAVREERQRITGKSAKELRIAISMAPGRVAEGWMTREGDPAPLYTKAINFYRESPAVFDTRPDRIAELSAPDRKRVDRGMEILIAASKLKGKAVLNGQALRLIGYEVRSDVVGSDLPSLRALQSLGDCAFRMAWFYGQQQDIPERERRAQELYEAQFSLGVKLFEERITFRELILGRNMMMAAIMRLDSRGEERRNRLKNLEEDLAALATKIIHPVWMAMWTNDPNVYEMEALVASSPEVMWRIEAILALGRARFRADPAQTYLMYEQSKAHATKLIESMLDSDHPQIREAARKATKLTERDWLMMSAAYVGRHPYELPEP